MKLTEFQEGFLADHGPKWIDMIKNDKYEDQGGSNFYNIGEYEYCVVGACHLFNDSYIHGDGSQYCKACEDYSIAIGIFYAISKLKNGNEVAYYRDDEYTKKDLPSLEKQFSSALTGFAKHFRTKHSHLPKSRRAKLKMLNERHEEVKVKT